MLGRQSSRDVNRNGIPDQYESGLRSDSALRDDYQNRRDNWDTSSSPHHGRWTSSNTTTNFSDAGLNRDPNAPGVVDKVKGLVGRATGRPVGGRRDPRDEDGDGDYDSDDEEIRQRRSGFGGRRGSDFNRNGIPDQYESGFGRRGSDLNRNGIPDQYESGFGRRGNDLNRNGIPDQYESGFSSRRGSDLNRNGIPDQYESGHFGSRRSNDFNGNGIPDQYESGLFGSRRGNDLNRNGIPDDLEYGSTYRTGSNWQTGLPQGSHYTEWYHPGQYGLGAHPSTFGTHPAAFGAFGAHPSTYGAHPSTFGTFGTHPSAFGHPSTFGPSAYGSSYGAHPSTFGSGHRDGTKFTDRIANKLRGGRSSRRSNDLNRNGIPDQYESSSRGFGRSNQPEVDIYELGNEYIIELDLPGFTRENVEMKLFGTELVLTCNPVTPTQRPTEYLLNERQGLRQMKRTLHLPNTADAKRINAQLSNGILRITVPRLSGLTIQPTSSLTGSTGALTGTTSTPNTTGTTATTTTAL